MLNFKNFKRITIARETQDCFDEIIRTYGQKIISGVKKTKFYLKTSPLKPRNFFYTKYLVINGDTIDIAIKLQKEEKLNPCVLNLASIFNPGGSWLMGTSGQEEQLFYRSTLDLSLNDKRRFDINRKWKYPIPITGGLYCPDVLVFRANENNDYAIWDYSKCVYLSFVVVAALKKPQISNNQLNHVDASVTKEKIRTILRVALINGHSSVLLGALGCGSYGNPPEHIARLFKIILHEDEFVNQFSHVIFGILKTKNCNNFEIFSKAFSDEIYTLSL